MADKEKGVVTETAALANELGRALRHQGNSSLAKTENYLAEMDRAEAQPTKPAVQTASGSSGLGGKGKLSPEAEKAAKAAGAAAAIGPCRDVEHPAACVNTHVAAALKKQGHTK